MSRREWKLEFNQRAREVKNECVQEENFTAVTLTCRIGNRRYRATGFAKYNPNDAFIFDDNGEPRLPYSSEKGILIARGRAKAKCFKQWMVKQQT